MTGTHSPEHRAAASVSLDNLTCLANEEYQSFIAGITEADKKDLVHWMAYREKRPPSPTPDCILEKIKSTKTGTDEKKIDRFVERK